MTLRSPDPLAGVVSTTASGERLVFVPRRIQELGLALGGGVMVPLWIAAPILLPVLLVAALTGSGLLWAVLWAGLGLAVVAVIALATAMVFVSAATMVRWIEFRPQGDAARVVIARLLRSSTVSAAGLQRVVVIERLRLGRRKSIAVVLHTREGAAVKCEPAFRAPLCEVRTEALIDWLTARLGPTSVAVEHRTEVDREFLYPDEWWTGSDLAALWHVPVSAVDELATRHGVRSRRYTPRAGAMYSAPEAVTVYHPGRAHEVAGALRAERETGPETNGTPHPPDQPPDHR
ncbi:hypothetical protein ACFVYP_33950 [Kitasatospora sp. NPDC058201]|uniref:hypothetical protein n=1 Tax=unclassified Kitasatospora TaxID=2633591 RepID=UPI0036627A98